jgi:hypothetical protein
MSIEIWALGNGIMLSVTPPHSMESFRNLEPLPPSEVVRRANELGVHSQDFWDAVVNAGLLASFSPE